MADVATSYGTVRGAEVCGVRCWYNIPFAAPPVGSLRFAPPAKHHGWSGSGALSCDVWQRREAPQSLSAQTAGEGVAFDRSLDRATRGKDGLPPWMSEDCLYLSVFAPKPAAGLLPVMVWIHGGGFTIGSGCSPQYNGVPLAAAGKCVVVSINYRLTGFGFLSAGEDAAFPSNLGLRDQIFALEWVRDEISRFGGDPANVTIFGESAGGMSVACLMGSPMAKGLFHKAIPQSGACHHCATPAEADKVAATLAKHLGLPADRALTPAALRAVPVKTLLDAMLKTAGVGQGMPFCPVVRGPVLPTHPLTAIEQGMAKDVCVFSGACAEEGRLFTFMMQRGAAGMGLGAAEKALEETLARNARTFVSELKTKEEIRAKAKAMVSTLASISLEADGVADKPEQPGGGGNGKKVGSSNGGRNGYEVLTRVMSDQMFDVPLKRMLDAHARSHSGRGKTYCYQFSWQSPVGGARARMGSCHALEMGFNFGFVGMDHDAVFGPAFAAHNAATGAECRVRFGRHFLPKEFRGALNFMGAVERGGADVAEALRLSELMTASWANFARTGDPTAGPSSPWPQYTPAEPFTVVFGEGQVGTAVVKPKFLRGGELGVYDGLWERVRSDVGKAAHM